MDRRARALPGEYRGKLANLDRQYHGTARGQVGPLQERLGSMGELQCLVVGRFGEGSTDLHVMLKRLAEARANNVARSMGRPSFASEAGFIQAQYRRIMATTFIRSQAICLLSRLGHMDEGARQAATRRQVTIREEEMGRREARAFFQAHVRGRGPRAGRLHRAA